MLRRKVVIILTMVAAGLLAGCGSGKKTPPPPQTGGVVIFVGDAPLCDVLSFRTTVTRLVLIPQNGGDGVDAFATTPFIDVNFASLRDLPTILHFGTVREGTYDKARFDLGLTQFAVFDPAMTPPNMLQTANLSESNPKFSIQPPLTVTKGKVAGLMVDFDLRRSIVVDAQGQVTKEVKPIMKLTPVTPSDTEGFGRLEELNGFVLTVATFSAVPDFTGSFALQTLSGTGSPVVNVNLTSNTELIGTPALNQLLTGSFVEVSGFVDSKGNLVAKTVEVEDQENANNNKLAFLGLVTSLTKDSNGNLTQFNLFVREEQPDRKFIAPLDSIVGVNVSPSTVYQFSSRSVNFAFLPFDRTSLAAGQEVVVHGTFNKATDGTVSVSADSVYLKIQAHEGNFSSLVKAGSDSKTGAFWLVPCGTIFQGKRILVLTNNGTAFVNVSGLSALTPQPSLLIKGLLFFELQGGTINGVTVPAGTPVLLANQVRQLP